MTIIMIKLVTIFIGMGLISGCPGNDERCAGCIGDVCQVCYDGYIDVNGLCVESSIEVQNCLEYLRDGQCRYCQHGYYVNNQGTCTKTDLKHCAEVDATNPQQCF